VRLATCRADWSVLRFTNDEALLEPGRLAEAVRRHAAKIGVEG